MRKKGAIIVSAYACSPFKGSEGGAGWNAVLAAVQNFQKVSIFTQPKNQTPLNSELVARGYSNFEIIPIDILYIRRSMRKRFKLFLYCYYILWQRKTKKVVKERARESQDVIFHHVTFASDLLPTACPRSLRRNYIWGPIGGLSRVPLHLWKVVGPRSVPKLFLFYMTHRLRIWIFQCRCRLTKPFVIAQNEYLTRYIPKSIAFEILTNVAVSSNRAIVHERTINYDLIGVGRLIGFKGWDILIRAMEYLPNRTLDLFGDGYDRRRLIRRIAKLGLADRVTLHHTVDNSRILEIMNQATVLVHPSLFESASWVVAESRVVGIPVISLASAGPTTMAMRDDHILLVDFHSKDLIRQVAKRIVESDSLQRKAYDWTDISFNSKLSEIYDHYA